jgi:septal ring factor EnvC (AmiA/AmiB activator)
VKIASALLPALVLALLPWGRGARAERDRDEPADSDAAGAAYQEHLELELEAVKKTEGLLADKYALRRAEMKQRVRAMYKLSRGTWPRLWFEPDARESASRWLGAARRITSRDIAEIALLEDEIAETFAAELRVKSAMAHEHPTATPLSLAWPVENGKILSGFGDYRGPGRRVRLRRRGVLLRARSGAVVRAPAAGRVRYVGLISGLGESLILEHGPEGASTSVSILGHLQRPRVDIGADVQAGTPIASAGGERIYLEHRQGKGALSQAIDPAPLLGDSR